MNKLLGIFLLSLILNATLAFAVFRAAPRGPSTPATATVASTAPAEKNPTTTTTAGSKGFQWTLLEPDDLKPYVAKLRLFGAPEKVIRDIILADIARMYRPKFAAVRGQKHVLDEKFWEHPSQQSQPQFDQTKDQREQERSLRKEQNEFARSLLGTDVFDQVAKDSGMPDWAEVQLGFVPPALRDQVEAVRVRYQDAQNDLTRDSNGTYNEFMEDDRRKLRQQLHTELASILSVDQLKEYELRDSQTASQLRGDLKWFEPTEQEFRALFEYRQAMEALRPPRDTDSRPTSPTADEAKAAFERQKPLEDTLAHAIGTNRVQEYLATSDWTYQSLLETGVPKESVVKIADIRRHAFSAARQINADASLSPEQRTDALTAVQAEAQKTVNELLNEKQLKTYENQGGGWLHTLAPTN